jgi:hypothetical protein
MRYVIFYDDDSGSIVAGIEDGYARTLAVMPELDGPLGTVGPDDREDCEGRERSH